MLANMADMVDTKDNNVNTPDKPLEVIVKNQNERKKNGNSINLSLSFIICFIAISLGLTIERFITQNSSRESKEISLRPKYWLYVHNSSDDSHLKHVHLVLGRLGYERVGNDSEWDLLWSFQYPFPLNIEPHLKPHQKVNHFPGSAPIALKVTLSTAKEKYIPRSFRLPKEKDAFYKYASENEESLFIEKNNGHRGVVLKNVTEMTMDGTKFVQEFVQKPFLVDGYKVDIGVYIVVTSVNPLRLYHYNADALMRYCPEKYYPFDPTNVNKYVVKEGYRFTWEVPTLNPLHNKHGYSLKEAFNIYARSLGKDADEIWQKVYAVIKDFFQKKENHIREALESKCYPSKNNFFELFRADLILDEDLNVYLMEVNFSPNLSSPKETNQLIYEQVLYSLFSIVGLNSPLHNYRTSSSRLDCNAPPPGETAESCLEKKSASNMLSAVKNLAVWGDDCATCNDTCGGICALCTNCLTPSDSNMLLEAYREHLHRVEFRRIFPPPMVPNSPINTEEVNSLSPKNKLLYLWFQGKCNIDTAWCS